VGATDPDTTATFFGAFGFGAKAGEQHTLERGLGHSTELVIAQAPAGRTLTAYDQGPRGLDLYTSNMEASLLVAEGTGANVGPMATVEIGPMIMKQVTVWGPDGIPLVLIENTSRRSSLLDTHPDELHSEIHSLVWAVADRDAETAWWASHGTTQGMALSFDDPAVATFMRLPDPKVAVNMIMLADAENNPIRFELLEFADHQGAAFPADNTAGIQAVGYTVQGAEPDRFVSPGGVVVDIR